VVVVVTPWVPVTPLSDEAFARLRRRAIFECHKWDPQVGDASVIARAPLVLRMSAWSEVARLAAALARETLAAEAELIARPDLHPRLGLPRGVRRALRHAANGHSAASAARLIRFDFHFTDEGWRISEANSDVPGGLNEASGFARLMAPHYPWAAMTGDPADAYCQALMAAAGSTSPIVALVHATAYSDDQQMMAYLAKRLDACGARTHLASPAHIRWVDGRAYLEAAWWRGPLDLVVRFFPSEWLPLLSARSGWTHFFAGARTPLSNPSTAILTQTKRFPLVWDDLRTPLPTWRALLPETRDPRAAKWRADHDWVLKPTLGRVGEGVGIAGAVEPTDWRRIRRSAAWWPSRWIAQRRFRTLATGDAAAPAFPCLGVYTVDGSVVGAYGRIAPRALVDARASDAAVLQAA
jgi:glutathionylspermidine synthase